MNIVLIGYRGSGKTTIGRMVAARLGRVFFDTDAMITERAGKTIKAVFEEDGEGAFREMETAVIAEVAGKEGVVIAVGGGAVLRGENVAAMKRTGRVIWLRADAETLFARISADAETRAMRPNLTAGGGVEEVRALLAVRRPLYEGAADGVVEVGGVSVEEAAAEVARVVGEMR